MMEVSKRFFLEYIYDYKFDVYNERSFKDSHGSLNDTVKDDVTSIVDKVMANIEMFDDNNGYVVLYKYSDGSVNHNTFKDKGNPLQHIPLQHISYYKNL